jgi:hypothetical protein
MNTGGNFSDTDAVYIDRIQIRGEDMGKVLALVGLAALLMLLACSASNSREAIVVSKPVVNQDDGGFSSLVEMAAAPQASAGAEREVIVERGSQGRDEDNGRGIFYRFIRSLGNRSAESYIHRVTFLRSRIRGSGYRPSARYSR